MIWTILPVCVFLLKTTMASIGSIGIPTVEYNSAKGQIAHASSFYDYTANPHYQYKYEPKNAIDGLVAGSSWWSSGAFNESVYWQLNFTDAPRKVKTIIVRWHGYQTAKAYRIRLALGDTAFRTLITAKNQSTSWDRIDHFENPSQLPFRFLRLQMDGPNICENEYECRGRKLQTQENPIEGFIYGIREVEVWTDGMPSDDAHHSKHPHMATTCILLFLGHYFGSK